MNVFTAPKHSSRLVGSALFLLMVFVSYSIMAQDAALPKSSYDCTRLAINNVDELELTRQEKLDMLEGAFFDSIDRYSECMDRVQADMAKSSGSGNGAANGSSTGSGINESSSSGTSSHNDQQNTNEASTQNVNQSPQPKPIHPGDTLPRGAPDQVIAPKDNDSIICKILYDEIANESDQAIKSGLIKQHDQYDCSK
ncbi:hypothetical protein MNBD_GAMMA26-1720 [hydrothermal vent metagenome]|uniref:Uncharacterized protein n=1 Tax=hydrothermal vent metagenome TaxID=652676 RepID=A0A3B1B7U9_9ZZZZ